MKVNNNAVIKAKKVTLTSGDTLHDVDLSILDNFVLIWHKEQATFYNSMLVKEIEVDMTATPTKQKQQTVRMIY